MASLLPPAERRSVVLVTVYAALSLVLLVVGERIPAAGLRGVGAALFAPFDRVTGAADRLFNSWNENEHLHERVARLEADNARLRLMAAENPHLREQLGLTAWRELPLKPVEVLALGGGEPLPDAATLSAGKNDGVEVGDAVMTSDGLVGRITESWGTLSRATLLTDVNQAIACEVETTGVNGIVRFVAAPRPRLVLSAVAISDTVRVGERVVTSDLSLKFPRGIPVGTVTRVDHDATGLMQEIEITPAARMARLRHAFVAPGPRPPADGVPRPKLEFEPDPLSGARVPAAYDSTGRKVR
ncbi:MAG TPA: rod shape-determining protein MreC [Verrucomicrobiae bacterium]|nr:rod shape-determining protein MreC [Verrucomicrobiae bacterium]